MNRSELGTAIFRASHLTGTFTLRSGAKSHEYFDKYLFESDPKLIAAIAAQLAPHIHEDIDALAGLETGGIPLAVMLSQATGLPTLFVRKEAKTYGTAKLAEGPPIENRRLLIIEDVVTSGGQVIASTKDLRERGATVQHALCVIDREAGGREALADHGVELTPLFTMTELHTLGRDA